MFAFVFVCVCVHACMLGLQTEPWMHLQPPSSQKSCREVLARYLALARFHSFVFAMLWFLVFVGALVAASCEVGNSTCDGGVGVTLLQSSARGVRAAPRPKPEHVEWQWGKSGGFVKWKGHHITVALDASMYRPVLS